LGKETKGVRNVRLWRTGQAQSTHAEKPAGTAGRLQLSIDDTVWRPSVGWASLRAEEEIAIPKDQEVISREAEELRKHWQLLLFELLLR
jgi:hypothetical protein